MATSINIPHYTVTNNRINALIQRVSNRINDKSILHKLKLPCVETRSREEIVNDCYLKVMSFNVGKMKTKQKRAKIMIDIISENPDIALIQESNLDESEVFEVDGYVPIPKPGATGLITLIKHNILYQEETKALDFGKNIEYQSFNVELKDKTLTVVNIYRNCTADSQAILDASKLFQYLSKQKNAIVAGDFNAHSILWEYKSLEKFKNGELVRTCKTATNIEKALDLYNIMLLNTGEPTHINGGSIDLTFATPGIASKSTWLVSDKAMSDHFATITYIQIDKVPAPPRRERINLNKTDWDKYRKFMDEMLKSNLIIPDDLDNMEKYIVDIFIAATEKATPKFTKNCYSNMKNDKFQNVRTKEINNRVNQLIKNFRKNNSEENKKALRLMQEYASEVYFEEYNNYLFTWCESLNCTSTLGKMWEKLKQIKGVQSPAFHPDPKCKANELMNNFANRTKTSNLPSEIIITQENLKPERTRIIEEAISSHNEILDKDFNEIELKSCLKNVMTGPGIDTVLHVQLYQACSLGHTYLLKLINLSKNEQKEPLRWKTAIIEALKKLDGSFRPISLISVISKLMENMILKRLEYYVGKLNGSLYAYTKGIGTQDAIAAVLHTITKSPRHHHTVGVMLDLEKAFELLNKEVILMKLTKKGVTGNILGWIKNFLQDRTAKVHFQGHFSESRSMENGTPQGSVLSAYLFNLVMDELLESLNLSQYINKLKVFCYADDLVIISTDYNSETARNQLQTMLNNIEEQCKILCLKVSLIKTKAIYFFRKDPDYNLKILSKLIPWVQSEKYLGVYIDKYLTFAKQIEYVCLKCQKKINFMKSLTSLYRGANVKVLKTFYIAAIRSIIDYSAPALQMASYKLLVQLEKIQNSAMRIILGAPPWTKIINMQNELKILPIIDRIHQITANLTVKTILSENSYLQREIKESSLSEFLNNPLMTLRNAQIKYSELTPDLPVYQISPWNDLALNMVVEKQQNKKDCSQSDLLNIYSKQINELDIGNDLVIYTDGSVILDRKGVSGSAAHINNSINETLCVIKLRISNNSSSTQTELVAILKTLELLETNIDWNHAIIHTDSLSSILSLEQRIPKDMKNIISNCQKIAAHLKERNQTIKLHYIPSHIGILGNECVDNTAKCAALRKNIDFRIAPSKAALKNNILQYFLEKQEKITIKDNNSKSIKWRKLVCKNLPEKRINNRNLEVIYHRIRLGFNTYHQLNRQCETCKYCLCSTNEPLVHYFSECPNTKSFFNIKDIFVSQHLSQFELAATLANYLLKLDNFDSFVSKFPPPR